MKNEIVVRENRSRMIGLWCLPAFIVIICIVLGFVSPMYFLVLLGVPPVCLICLAESGRQIILARDKIVVKTLFTRREYSYYQITDAQYRNSTAYKGWVVRLKFQDGHQVHFRMGNENAQKAIRALQSHISIRVE